MHCRSIQALRAVAALLVVAFHLSEGRLKVGQAGVDVFFLISGFIMATVGARESPNSFAVKRVARIVPLYWIVTLLIVAAARVGAFSRLDFSSASVAKSLLFIPYADASGHIWPVVVAGWTLNLELLFYALFIIGLMVGAPVRLTAILLAALVAAGAITHPIAVPLQMWTSPLLLEFVAGMALAAWRPIGAAKGVGMVFVGIAGLVLSATLWGYTDANRVLVWGVPATLIVGGCLAIERSGCWPWLLAPLEGIGDASYSLYLLHGPIIGAMHHKFEHSATVYFATVLTSVAIALVSFRYFERPISKVLVRSLLRLHRSREPMRA